MNRFFGTFAALLCAMHSLAVDPDFAPEGLSFLAATGWLIIAYRLATQK